MLSSRFAYVALASAALAPACGGSDTHRTAIVPDGGDAGPAAGGTQSSNSGGAAGRAGAPAGGGGSTSTGGAAPSDGGVDVTGDASVDASVDSGSSPPVDPCVGEDSDATPPLLTSALFIAPDTVQLTFSEPIRTTVDVDPTRFRLSVVNVQNFEGAFTNIQDLNLVVPPHVDGGGDVSTYAVESLGGTCSNTVTAKIATPISVDDLCPALATLAASTSFPETVGVFLHYFGDGTNGLVDRAGIPLASISPAFATPVLPDGGGRLTELQGFDVDVDAAVRLSLPCKTPDAGP